MTAAFNPMRPLSLLLILGLLPASLHADLEHSVISLQATRKVHSYSRPWQRETGGSNKTAIMIRENEFLTTAEGLQDLTMLRLQKYGRGRWWGGRLKWIDHHANLAVVAADEAAFAKDLQPAQLSPAEGDKTGWEMVRWKSGNLERRAAEFNQYLVQEGRLTFMQHLQMEVSSEIDGVGWGEPLIADGKVIAISAGQSGNNVRLLPVSFFKRLLDSRQAGKPRRLGYFPFMWSPVQNPDLFAFLKLPGEPRGALVLDVPKVPAVKPNLKVRDLILEVDGNPIDNEGYYRDPDHGLMILENLSTRGKLAGDKVRMKIWREGREMTLDYPLPAADFGHKLLRFASYDHEPEYLIVGGLVFQPLDIPLLKAFGNNWESRAPLNLTQYTDAVPTRERPGLVALSMVIPDPFNLGYQDQRWLVVDKVNGCKIGDLKDLNEALAKPTDGFHELHFMRGSHVEHMVLDVKETGPATARILRQYRIPAASYPPMN
jgi:hypothetical protein